MLDDLTTICLGGLAELVSLSGPGRLGRLGRLAGWTERAGWTELGELGELAD